MYTIKSGNTIFIANRVEMGPNAGATAPTTKQCYVRAPYIFKERPVVTVTVSTESASTPMLVYGVEQDLEATGETLFKVSALSFYTNVANESVYFCDFTMVGELKD
jgi:hypothetical protein